MQGLLLQVVVHTYYNKSRITTWPTMSSTALFIDYSPGLLQTNTHGQGRFSKTAQKRPDLHISPLVHIK